LLLLKMMMDVADDDVPTRRILNRLLASLPHASEPPPGNAVSSPPGGRARKPDFD